MKGSSIIPVLHIGGTYEQLIWHCPFKSMVAQSIDFKVVFFQSVITKRMLTIEKSVILD